MSCVSHNNSKKYAVCAVIKQLLYLLLTALKMAAQSLLGKYHYCITCYQESQYMTSFEMKNRLD